MQSTLSRGLDTKGVIVDIPATQVTGTFQSSL